MPPFYCKLGLMERLYFTWEEGPAVIESYDDGKDGFFIAENESDWSLATPKQFADFLLDGSKMLKEEFESKFGVIGADLPELPDVT